MSFCERAGIIFTVCCEPYLDSEYGDAFVSDSPVRLMDLTMYGHREVIEQEVCFHHTGSMSNNCIFSWKVGSGQHAQ